MCHFVEVRKDDRLFFVKGMDVSGFSCTPVASISVISVVLSGYTDMSCCSYKVDYSFNNVNRIVL